MNRITKPDVILGFLTLIFALVLLLFWIPNDIKGEIINTVRGRASIGDPLAPTLVAVFLLVSGLMLVLTGLFRPVEKEGFSLGNALFMLCAAGFVGLVLTLMYFTGPVLVAVFGVAEEYRFVRADAPWKYAGFLLGGFVLMLGAMSAVERRVSGRALLLAILVPLVIALFYDLPFDDTLLPPNGDY